MEKLVHILLTWGYLFPSFISLRTICYGNRYWYAAPNATKKWKWKFFHFNQHFFWRQESFFLYCMFLLKSSHLNVARCHFIKFLVIFFFLNVLLWFKDSKVCESCGKNYWKNHGLFHSVCMEICCNIIKAVVEKK